jgi:hypothetical protein
MTDIGINSIAYREAWRRGWMTVGVCCHQAMERRVFPCDIKVYAGQEFGDIEETAAFLDGLNFLIRIGGGPTSLTVTELARAKGLPIREYNL